MTTVHMLDPIHHPRTRYLVLLNIETGEHFAIPDTKPIPDGCVVVIDGGEGVGVELDVLERIVKDELAS